MDNELRIASNPNLFNRLEKYLTHPPNNYSSIELLITEVILEILRRQPEFCEGPKEAYKRSSNLLCQNFEKHEEDVLYLCKSGFGLKNILTRVSTTKNWSSNYFIYEKKILNKYEYSWINRAISRCYKDWLVAKTSYLEILSHTTKADSERFYAHKKFRLDLPKRMLQRVFSSASEISQGLQGSSGKLLRGTLAEGVGFFVIYEDLDERINVLFSKIAEDFVVGKSDVCAVQEVVDLKNKNLLAMKYPCQRGNFECLQEGESSIRNEVAITRQLRKILTSECFNLPEIYVEEEGFEALIGPRFLGDCYHFLGELNEDSPFSLKDLLSAFLELLKGVCELTEHEYVHGDFKPDNIFYEYVGDEKRLSFVISDFNYSASFDEIIELEIFNRHLKKYRVKADFTALIRMSLYKAAKSEYAKVFEKQEVLAFGKTILEIATNKSLEEDFDMVEHKEIFIETYGEDFYNFFERMLRHKHVERYTFEQAAADLERIIFASSEVLEKRLFQALKQLDGLMPSSNNEEFGDDQEAWENDDDEEFDPQFFFPDKGGRKIIYQNLSES